MAVSAGRQVRALNLIRRILHVPMRWMTFAMIGVGALILAFLVFPVLRTLVHPGWRFRKAMRATVSFCFWLVTLWLRGTSLIRIKFTDRDRLRQARGKIIMANHPSILDVVILIAHTPQADCIVTARMWANPFMRGVVNSIFIPNSIGIEAVAAMAAKSLAEGNNLIIFPEGTRTVRGKMMRLQRGGAHIALRTGADFLPIRIEASDPVGLRKGDGPFTAPPDGIISYNLHILEAMPTTIAPDIDSAKAARMLTSRVGSLIVSYQ